MLHPTRPGRRFDANNLFTTLQRGIAELRTAPAFDNGNRFNYRSAGRRIFESATCARDPVRRV